MRVQRQVMSALLVFVAAMLLAAFAASGAEVIITHLTYDMHGSDFHDYLQRRAEAFNTKNPAVRVEIVVGNHDKFNVMAAGGVAPDIVDLPDFEHLGAKGMLVNLRPLIERDNIARLVSKPMVDFVTMPNGEIYSAPFEVGSTPAFFNRELFEKAGLVAPDKLGKEWTWEAALASSKKITKDADGDGVPEVFGLDRPWGYWRRAVFQAGGDFIQVDRNLNPVKSLFSSREVLRGVEYVAEYYRNRLTAHTLMTWDQHTAFYFWKGGSALDFCDGMGIVGAYLAKVAFDWDFALQPRGPAGPIGEIGVGGPHIVSSSSNVAQAWEWVKFLAYDKDALQSFISLTGRLPALQAAQPSYAAVQGILDKNYNLIFEQTMYPAPKQYPVPKDINSRFVSLDPVWKGEEPAETFLQAIHDKMTSYIREMEQAK